MKEAPNSYQPIIGSFTLERATAIEKVAGEFGLPFKALAQPGDVYPDRPNLTVSANHVLIRLGNGGQGDLSKFWRRVDEECPMPPDLATSNSRIDTAEKPWDGLRFSFDNEGYKKMIDLVHRGTEKKDKDGKPIDQNDAEFTIVVGVLALRGITAMTKRHHGNINLDLVEEAKKIEKDNGEKVNEYVRNYLENVKKPTYLNDNGIKLTSYQAMTFLNVLGFTMFPNQHNPTNP